jgi:hypothetical protein
MGASGWSSLDGSPGSAIPTAWTHKCWQSTPLRCVMKLLEANVFLAPFGARSEEGSNVLGFSIT